MEVILRILMLAALAAFGLLPAQPAAAQSTGPECAAIEDGGTRLTCYDSVFRTSTAAPVIAGKGAWRVTTETSKITDKTDVFLNLESDQRIPEVIGGGSNPATLVIRCLDDITSLTIFFAGQFMADSGGFDRVTYRVDKQVAVQDRWDASTDNKHLGLWSGSSSIPLIRKLFNADNFLVQATPFNENPITLDFKVGGLEEAIKPVREACGW